MATLSVRIPEAVKKELTQFAKDEKLEQPSEAARKILAIGLEKWRQERALQLLAEGRLSFAAAAKRAKMDVWQFAVLVRERRSPWVTDSGIAKDIQHTLG